jgi:replicative DNA helicase
MGRIINMGAEEQFIGTLLNREGDISGAFDMPTDYLGHYKHRIIFEAMQQTDFHKSSGFPFPFLITAIRNNGFWNNEEESVPDKVNLDDLISFQEKSGPISAIPGLIHLIEISYRQRLLSKLGDIVGEGKLDSQMTEKELGETEDKLIEIAYHSKLTRISKTQTKHIDYYAGEATNKSSHTTPLPTRISVQLDNILGGGFRPGESILLAGRPSQGKSALAINIISKTAPNGLVVFFSLEMDGLSIAQRLISGLANIDLRSIRSQSFFSNEFATEKIMGARNELSKWKLYIEDRPNISVHEMIRQARMISQREDSPLSLVVIDYLQLIKPRNSRDPREQQISLISRSIKGMAKLLYAPVLTISQLNRAVGYDTKDHKPALHHLRESGAIEQDADTVLAIYHKHPNNSPDVDICVLKQRNGPIGDIGLRWQSETTTFKEM